MSDEIVVIGEALIDLIGQPDGSYQAKTGGAPANVSIALARLGVDVTYITRMSTDPFGQQLHAWLSRESIDLNNIIRTSDPTTLAVATLDDHGKASYSFYINATADWGLTDADLSPLLQTPPRALVMGSVALAVAPSSHAIEHIASELHRRNESSVVFDLNIRPGLGFSRADEVTRVRRQVGVSHIVKASDEDIAWLYGPDLVDSTAIEWSADGRVVIVTRGSAGASVFAHGERVADASAPRVSLVDTVGAGDSFLGAIVFGLSELDAIGTAPSTRLSSLSDSTWSDVVSLATRVGAITCSRAGCNPPTRAELGL